MKEHKWFLLLGLFLVISSLILVIGFDTVGLTSTKSTVSLDGYWVLRAPVDSDDITSGNSFARRYGEVQGNGQDVGVLWKLQTLDFEGGLIGDEKRHCGCWSQFYFDEAITYGNIENIYCHVWANAENMGSVSMGLSGNISDEMFNCFGYNEGTRDYWSRLEATPTNASSYNLGIYWKENLSYPFFSQEHFNKLSFKVSGGTIQIMSYSNQKSFCMVNLADESVLRNQDNDSDMITDYDELFVHYTDPQDSDTDDDGVIDFIEIKIGKNPLDPYDLFQKNVYFSENMNITYKTINNVVGNISFFSAQEVLEKSFNSDEYNLVKEYDLDNIVSLNLFTIGSGIRSSLAQYNIKVPIQESLLEIREIIVLAGGNARASGSEIEYEFSTIIQNLRGGEDLYFPGRKQPTSAQFMKKINKEQLNDFIDEQGNLFFKIAVKVTGKKVLASFDLDWAEVWVVYDNSSEYPVIQPIQDIVVNERDLITIPIEAVDPQGDNLYYFINDSRFTQENNVFTWKTGYASVGIYSFLVTVTDGDFFVTKTINVEVKKTIPEEDRKITCSKFNSWKCKLNEEKNTRVFY